MELKMEYIIDMVHHNPGEAEFETKFSDPKVLKDYGYTHKCSKHINCATTFADFDSEIMEKGTKDREFVDNLAIKIHKEIDDAKKVGVKYLYHIDLFVLPKKLVEKYKNEICDENGRISIAKNVTKVIHRAMFDEIFSNFDIDGFIIRIGETYLHDTPYHTGNGPVNYQNKTDFSGDKDTIIQLIEFLREEICVKHNKTLIFRTWDCYNDKFHANAEFYLDITDKIEPHSKLIFSVKHTMLDFWRNVNFNPCLAIGRHKQVIEVQCQREYEGKGAYANYVAKGIIKGFGEENPNLGIEHIMEKPQIVGVYTWSRGGGWYGPYIKDEFWCDLNTYVISQYFVNFNMDEKDIFRKFATEKMSLTAEETDIFYKLCEITESAVLQGRYCTPYDSQFNGGTMPCENWMRDDRLGGYRQLEPVWAYLFNNDLIGEALEEKRQCCLNWDKIKILCDKIKWNTDIVPVCVEYGRLLFTYIYCGWVAMAEGYIAEKNGEIDKVKMSKLIQNYDDAKLVYENFCNNTKLSASPYCDVYLDGESGLGDSINILRNI